MSSHHNSSMCQDLRLAAGLVANAMYSAPQLVPRVDGREHLQKGFGHDHAVSKENKIDHGTCPQQ